MTPTYADYLQWLNQQERMQQPVQQQMVQPILSYVANKTAADLFNVNPGQDAILIDMDMPYVYKKSRGADGKLLPLEMYELVPFKEKETIQQAVNLEGYVRYEDINNIVAKEVDKRISEAFARPSRKKTED